VRRLLRLALELALVAAAIAVSVVGVARWGSAHGTHDRALAHERAAAVWQQTLVRRFKTAKATRAELRAEIARRRRQIRNLSRQRLHGFPAAVAAGTARGARRGEAWGRDSGETDGLAWKTEIPAPGWYMLRVVEDARGLPGLDDIYRLQIGAERAYRIDGATREVHYRGTTP
jgi:hypothetical protein